MYNNEYTSRKNTPFRKPVGVATQQKKPRFDTSALQDDKLHRLDEEQKQFHVMMMQKYRGL